MPQKTKDECKRERQVSPASTIPPCSISPSDSVSNAGESASPKRPKLKSRTKTRQPGCISIKSPKTKAQKNSAAVVETSDEENDEENREDTKTDISERITKRPKVDIITDEKSDTSNEDIKSTKQEHDEDKQEGKKGGKAARETNGNPKARLSAESKRKIAEEIIKRGVVHIDVTELSKVTGLSSSQIRSQIVDNRQNIRKQLMQLAAILQ